MECVFTSEIDDFARKTYRANFKDKYLENPNLFTGDIWKVDFKKIPDFDILCAGFPCQPFSQAGYKKGFNDNKDGNLFFSIEGASSNIGLCPNSFTIYSAVSLSIL